MLSVFFYCSESSVKLLLGFFSIAATTTTTAFEVSAGVLCMWALRWIPQDLAQKGTPNASTERAESALFGEWFLRNS